MKIEYTIYSGQKIGKQLVTSFIDKNVFKLQTSIDSYVPEGKQSVEMQYYKIIYCENRTIQYFSVNNNSLIKETSLDNWGSWAILEREYKYQEQSPSKFMGYSSLLVEKTVEDKNQYSQVSYELEFIDSHFLRDVISKKYVKYLLFSAMRQEGREFDGFDLLGRSRYMFAGQKLTTAQITKITAS